MSVTDLLSPRIEKGLNKLIDILFQNIIFTVYYTFEKLKNTVKKENKSFEIKNAKDTKQDTSPLVTAFENCRRNIEQSIDLLLIMLNTLEGNPTAIQQFVLENYTNKFLEKSTKTKNTKYITEEYKKRQEKLLFYETLLLSRLCENERLPKEKEKNELSGTNNTGVNEYKNSFQKQIQRIEDRIKNEKIIILKNRKEDKNYCSPVSFKIDSIWKEAKKYTKNGYLHTLNDILNTLYLKKHIGETTKSVVLKEVDISSAKEIRNGKSEDNEEDVEDDNVSQQLFFHYFNNSRRNEQFNTLLEVNINNLLQLHNMLVKDVEYAQSFYNLNLRKKTGNKS